MVWFLADRRIYWWVLAAIPCAGGRCPTAYAYSAYLALSYIHPPTLISSSTFFFVRSHSLVPCFSNISNALSQSAGYSLKVSVIYIKVFLSMLQPGYLTFTWSSSTLFNPLSPHPSLLPDLPALLLLIPPSSSSTAGGLRPQNWKISNTLFLIPHPINSRLSLSQWSFIIILSPLFHKPYSLFCSCF